MPGVGKKKFAYSPMGRLQANKESRRTGLPVRNTQQPMSRPMSIPMSRPMSRPMGRPMGRPMC